MGNRIISRLRGVLNSYVTDDSLIRQIVEKDDTILVTFKARPSGYIRVALKKDTIIDWYDAYCEGGVNPPPAPEELGEYRYSIGNMSDPHYDVNINDQSEYSNDIENCMEFFARIDALKFVACCGDMCDEKNKDLVMFTRLWANKAKVLNGGTWPADGKTGFQLIETGIQPLPKMRLLSCMGNHDVRQVDGQTSQGFNDPRTANKWGSIARLLRPDGTTVTWEDEVTSDDDYGTQNAPSWINGAGNETNRDYSISALREYFGSDDNVYFCGYDDVWSPGAGWGTYNRLLASAGGWDIRGGRSKTNFYIKLKSDGSYAMPYLQGGQYVDDTDFDTIAVFMSADYGTDPNVNECWRFDHPYGLLNTSTGYAKDVQDYVLDNEQLLGNANLYDITKEGNFNYQFYDCRVLLWLEQILRTNPDKRVLIFHHHPFPQKAGNGKSVDGTGYYASKNGIRPYHLTGDGKNNASAGSYQLCGVQFHFLNILNRKYKNAIFFTGHSHLIWEDDEYDPYLNFCNKEFDYLQPTAAEGATDYNGSTNVPAFYTRTSDVATEECGWNVHLPSLSRPKTLSDGTELKLPYASEGALLEVYEHGIRILPIIFKENSSGLGGRYINRFYGNGLVVLDSDLFGE
jgi:hypothetical protein